MIEASAYAAPFAHLQKLVLPTRQRKAEEGRTADGEQRSHHKAFLKYWWRHSFDRPELISLLSALPRYIVCSDTTKRPIFAFISREVRPDHKLRLFVFADDYSFGILQSYAHRLWFITKCSKLTERFNYTSSTVFDTFPWPLFQTGSRWRESARTSSDDSAERQRGLMSAATEAKVRAVAEAGREVRRVRAEALRSLKGGLRALYRTLEFPGANPLKDANATLDTAVLAAYGFNPKTDLLGQLFEQVTVRAAGQPTLPPHPSPLPSDGRGCPKGG